MQSFLPLVLDGDKRPVRLDPFGSKDRKIEYYMLGETDNSAQDRTGYLYLEFVQPETHKYVTVGIGLRARRGAAQVGFWGFAITDQRRIGHDVFLYDRDLYEAHGQKVPLDRAGLEAALGDGGKVVREQREYRNLVNQLLFGFADGEAFKDLLSLMIQLRSPKLSKEFRPGAIYDILNQALPPLSDEDLRPLAEVLEDLDQITDRLQELARHRGDAEKLHAVYQQYNEMRLFKLGQGVTEASSAFRAKDREVAEQKTEWTRLNAEYDELTQTITTADGKIREAEIEIDLLEHSKEMEQQRELEEGKGRLREVERDLEHTEKRHEAGERELADKRQRDEQLRQNVAARVDEQTGWRKELSALADAMEFADHALYEEHWNAGTGKTDDGTWDSLRRDVGTYKARLKAILDLNQRVSRQGERVHEAERGLSQARERQDAQERKVHAAEAELQTALVRQEDKLLHWHRTLHQLPLAPEAWRQVLRQLQKYPQVSYADVTSPIQQAHADAQLAIQQDRVVREHEKRQVVLERDGLRQDLERWGKQRDPEPERSEATLRARARRSESSQGQGGTLGGPLYTLCDFQPHVDDTEKANMETALHKSGLLDAWVGPLGWQLADGEEETWIQPNPALFGLTLADYLQPTPTTESGLSLAQVDAVLRTIVIGNSVAAGVKTGVESGVETAVITAETPGTGAALLGNGQFRIGPLTGQVVAKARAEWIGHETRKQTRLLEMKRLEAGMAALTERIAMMDGRLAELDEKRAAMDGELKALPPEAELRTVSDELREARWTLTQEIRVVEGLSDQYKTAQRQWRDLQQSFLEQVSAWSRLKRELDFQTALNQLDEYQQLANELKSSYAIGTAMEVEARRLRAEIVYLEAQVGEEQAQLAEYRHRRQDLRTRVAMLEQLLAESGALGIYERLQAKKDARTTWFQHRDAARESREKSGERRGASYERLQQKESELESAVSQLVTAEKLFRVERQFGFVRMASVEPTSASGQANGVENGVDAQNRVEVALDTLDSLDDVVKLAQTVLRTFKSRYESRNLENIAQQVSDVFSLVKNSLIEYSLEQRFDDELKRLFIESHRDRSQPLAPEPLLHELRRLEEQQRVLIDEKDRELYEHILLRSVGRAIRDRINRAEQWVEQMNRFMAERKTSSGLILSLAWLPRSARNERELDTDQLVRLLRKSPDTLRTDEVEEMMSHFRSRIQWAKEAAADGETLREAIHSLLDYRSWFNFQLSYKKGEQPKRELTDARFNVLSGGEKAMAMYIPLFAATDSRYKDSRDTAPRIISLDEAFAGVDEQNMRDMFQLLTDMKFDYMMTSQQLWGCYDTVPSLAIYEVFRPNDANFITLIPYFWNGEKRRLVMEGDWQTKDEVAATKELEPNKSDV